MSYDSAFFTFELIFTFLELYFRI